MLQVHKPDLHLSEMFILFQQKGRCIRLQYAIPLFAKDSFSDKNSFNSSELLCFILNCRYLTLVFLRAVIGVPLCEVGASHAC